MSKLPNGLTPAQLAAYHAKRDYEQPEREALNKRYIAANTWLVTNFTSLSHWRRYVEAVEQIISTFRAEERQQSFSRACSFLRELMADDPVLWANQIALTVTPYRPEELR